MSFSPSSFRDKLVMYSERFGKGSLFCKVVSSEFASFFNHLTNQLREIYETLIPLRFDMESLAVRQFHHKWHLDDFILQEETVAIVVLLLEGLPVVRRDYYDTVVVQISFL